MLGKNDRPEDGAVFSPVHQILQTLPLGLVLQAVNDGDVRVDFNGLSVENRGAVAPLAHGIRARIARTVDRR